MPALTQEHLRDAARRLRTGETTLEAEATPHSLADLAETMRTTRGRLQAIAEGWTQGQLRMHPAGGDGEDSWSATQAISHLMATQNWYILHMSKLLGETRYYEPMPRGLGDHATDDRTQRELADDLRSATDMFLAFIAAIPPDADLTATRNSHFFGQLSLRGWVRTAISHDHDHAEQIERLRALPGFAQA